MVCMSAPGCKAIIRGQLKDASGCGSLSLHCRLIGGLRLLSFLWLGCSLFDTFPISIFNSINDQMQMISEINIRLCHVLCYCNFCFFMVLKSRYVSNMRVMYKTVCRFFSFDFVLHLDFEIWYMCTFFYWYEYNQNVQKWAVAYVAEWSE